MLKLIRDEVAHLFDGDWKMDPVPWDKMEVRRYTKDDLIDDIEELTFWAKNNHGFGQNVWGGYEWADEGFNVWLRRKFHEGFL